MNEFVIIPIEQLKAVLGEIVLNAFQKIHQHQPEQEETLLRRKDVAKLFSVSLVTISDWTKTGKLKKHRINSRVYYKKSEVWAAMEINPKYKRDKK